MHPVISRSTRTSSNTRLAQKASPSLNGSAARAGGCVVLWHTKNTAVSPSAVFLSKIFLLVIFFAAQQVFHVLKGAVMPEVAHHFQQFFQQGAGLRVEQVVGLAALVVF